jgi:hypothetical protein
LANPTQLKQDTSEVPELQKLNPVNNICAILKALQKAPAIFRMLKALQNVPTAFII